MKWHPNDKKIPHLGAIKREWKFLFLPRTLYNNPSSFNKTTRCLEYALIISRYEIVSCMDCVDPDCPGHSMWVEKYWGDLDNLGNLQT